MRKVSLFLIVFLFAIFFYNLVFSQVEPVDPLPSTSFKPLQSIQQRAFNPVFAGKRIVNLKATQIQTLESAGFECVVPGETIEISPVGKSRTSYFVPSGVKPKSNFVHKIGQKILGKTKGETTITCIQPETGATQTVSLPTIVLYSTSRI